MIDEEEVIMVLEQSNMLCQKVKLMPQSRTNNILIKGITLGCIETEIIVPYSSYVLMFIATYSNPNENDLLIYVQ